MCSTHNTTHGIDIFSSFILVCGADLMRIVILTCYRGGWGIERTVLALNLFYTIPKCLKISMPWVVLWVEHNLS